MKATVPYIEQKFEGLNRQMLGGKLPKIPVELSDDGVPRSVEHCRDIRWWSPGVGRALPGLQMASTEVGRALPERQMASTEVGRALPERQEPSPGVSFICISYLTKYLIQTMPSCSFTDLNFRRMGLRFLGRPSNAAAIPSRPSMP